MTTFTIHAESLRREFGDGIVAVEALDLDVERGEVFAFLGPNGAGKTMFLTTAFAPLNALTGWLHTAATLNPITYFLRGLRALAMDGWDVDEIALGFLVTAAVGLVTLTFAFMALPFASAMRFNKT